MSAPSGRSRLRLGARRQGGRGAFPLASLRDRGRRRRVRAATVGSVVSGGRRDRRAIRERQPSRFPLLGSRWLPGGSLLGCELGPVGTMRSWRASSPQKISTSSSAPQSTPGRRSSSPSARRSGRLRAVPRPRRRPPAKAQARSSFRPTRSDQVVVGTEGGFEAACVRLRVANGERKDTADDVVVMVTEVRRLEDSETAPAETQPIGLPPTWSGSTPPLTVASVHPGSERHIDLLHVDWPAGDEIDIARTTLSRRGELPEPARLTFSA